jgi:TfoX/Sxy family transcriptional regulator of competence genes
MNYMCCEHLPEVLELAWRTEMSETDDKPKMKWEHAPDDLVQTFMGAVKVLPGVEVRKMFGYPCVFFRGQMFSGLHQSSMIVRLSDEDRAVFMTQGARPFEPMPGRPMKEYVVVPLAVISNEEQLDAWLIKHCNMLHPFLPKPPGRKSRMSITCPMEQVMPNLCF